MEKKRDGKKLLSADPTDWLLEDSDPGVRYLALRDIVEADEKEVKAARSKAHKEGPIAKILAEMNPEGYWVSPGHVYANKCRGTVWSIISLAQLGASVEEDKRVFKACAYLMDNALAPGGQFSSTGQPEGTFDCLQGNLLTSLMDMGVRDSRLDAAYEWTARTVTGVGMAAMGDKSSPLRYYKYKSGPLFACRSNRYLPCAWGGVKVMAAFSRLPAERRTGLMKRAVKAGTEYFLNAGPANAAFPGDNAPEPDLKWFKFGFPLFWVADILQIAEVFTRLGCAGDPHLAKTIVLIREKQDENGRWPLELDLYRNRMWQNYGSKGKPNKWVTLRAMRVLKNCENH